MIDKHTPAPWAITGMGNLVSVSLPKYPKSGGFLGINLTDMEEANAKHIVKCVNCHYELLESLENLTNATNQYNKGICSEYESILIDAETSVAKARDEIMTQSLRTKYFSLYYDHDKCLCEEDTYEAVVKYAEEYFLEQNEDLAGIKDVVINHHDQDGEILKSDEVEISFNGYENSYECQNGTKDKNSLGVR